MCISDGVGDGFVGVSGADCGSGVVSDHGGDGDWKFPGVHVGESGWEGVGECGEVTAL